MHGLDTQPPSLSKVLYTKQAVVIMSISQIGKPRLGEAEQTAYQEEAKELHREPGLLMANPTIFAHVTVSLFLKLTLASECHH